jgi:hypothetical protein
MEWALSEMQTANLGDKRLNKRLTVLLDTLGSQPEASIPTACGGWAETKAAYRFFGNKNVSSNKILEPHRMATLERIRQHNTVLLIQDTTTLNFSGQHNKQDIGPINHFNHQGLLLHPTIAVTPERLCLGVIDDYHWARSQGGLAHRRIENYKIPIKEKESNRWLMGYNKAQEIANLLPNTRIISIADREGDLYELYHEAHTKEQTPSAYWLIRAKANRRILDENNKRKDKKLIEAVKDTSPIGIIEFVSPGRNKDKERLVRQEIYVAKIRLKPPYKRGRIFGLNTVETNVVIASEIDVPSNQKPVEWILLTNVPIENAIDAHQIVKWYLCRWQIEIYFRILKSGCKVEKLQLEEKSRFDACLTLYMIIAWRILYLTMLNRDKLDLPCTSVFADEEWKVAYMMKYRKKVPSQPISLSCMMNIIAQFGGYLNRKSDAMPGPTVVWRGLQKLRDFTNAKEIIDQINSTYG